MFKTPVCKTTFKRSRPLEELNQHNVFLLCQHFSNRSGVFSFVCVHVWVKAWEDLIGLDFSYFPGKDPELQIHSSNQNWFFPQFQWFIHPENMFVFILQSQWDVKVQTCKNETSSVWLQTVDVRLQWSEEETALTLIKSTAEKFWKSWAEVWVLNSSLRM